MLENRTTSGPPFAWGPSKPRRLDTTIAWGLIRLHPFILDKSGERRGKGGKPGPAPGAVTATPEIGLHIFGDGAPVSSFAPRRAREASNRGVYLQGLKPPSPPRGGPEERRRRPSSPPPPSTIQAKWRGSVRTRVGSTGSASWGGGRIDGPPRQRNIRGLFVARLTGTPPSRTLVILRPSKLLPRGPREPPRDYREAMRPEVLADKLLEEERDQALALLPPPATSTSPPVPSPMSPHGPLGGSANFPLCADSTSGGLRLPEVAVAPTSSGKSRPGAPVQGRRMRHGVEPATVVVTGGTCIM